MVCVSDDDHELTDPTLLPIRPEDIPVGGLVNAIPSDLPAVEEIEGNPGYYSSKFFLRPHYQLEGLTVSLRLVSKLPSAKGGA